MAEKLLGKPLVNKLRESLKERIQMLNTHNIFPKVVGLYNEDDKPSMHYFKSNARLADKLGMDYELESFSSEASTEQIIEKIQRLNGDAEVHGIMLGLPLAKSLDQMKIINSIAADKDIDGQSNTNLGRLMTKTSGIVPNTPRAALGLLKHYNIQLAGKHVVVIGRSPVVGKTLGLLLLNEDATVTIAHSKTKNLAELTRQADILCVAAGKPGLVNADMVKSGAVVLDIGTTYDTDGHVTGDVDTEAVAKYAGAVSPVPGGVGPVTNIMMLDQLITHLEKTID